MSALPEGWARCVLRDLLTTVTSGSRDWSKYYATEGALFVRTENINTNRLGPLHEIARVALPDSIEGKRTLIRKDDLLITITGANVGKCAHIDREIPEAYVSQSVALVRLADVSLARFVHKQLIAPGPDGDRTLLQETAYGLGRPVLNLDNVRDVALKIAPVREQKRIVDKLDALLARVDACRERLNRVPTILKRLRQSVLAAATSGELTREWREGRGDDGHLQSFQLEDAEAIRDYSFPASWSIRRLSDIATITGGVTKDSKKQSTDFPELPYLRVANVQRGYLDLREMKTIRVPPERVDDLILRSGDILFNEGGDIDKLGRGWIWSGEIPECVFQNHVFRARLLDSTFEPRYFSWYGNSRGYDYFLARGKQTTNLASINKSVLSALPVAVPPPAEQAEIVRRTQDLLQLAERLERRCIVTTDHVGSLTPSSLAKAFRGELVPQDPDDEPASELLARIRSRHVSLSTGKPKRGSSREPRTKAKVESDMLTRKDVTATHLTSILKERGALTAEALWNASQLEIDEFYDQLKDEEARGLLRENRGDLSTAARLLEATA